jgi:hypothetical protein
MQIVAILYKSAGNETVGDMWRETKVFEPTTPVIDIFKWASNDEDVTSFKGHLEITIAKI